MGPSLQLFDLPQSRKTVGYPTELWEPMKKSELLRALQTEIQKAQSLNLHARATQGRHDRLLVLPQAFWTRRTIQISHHRRRAAAALE
jgi:hypothetical protein